MQYLSMSNMNRKIEAFILTHGRSDKVKTDKALRKSGFTGRIRYIVDSLDSHIDNYRRKYGDDVVVFSKYSVSDITDTFDTSMDMRGVVYARNACDKIAKEVGASHYFMLDDDYSRFGHVFDSNGKYRGGGLMVQNLDSILGACADALDQSNITSIAFAQGGDFIGGEQGKAARFAAQKKYGRKIMNTFFIKTGRPIKFLGRINEDVNAYVCNPNGGDVYLTNYAIRVTQEVTQKSSGGMTTLYTDGGTYKKSMYSVVCAPSCVSVSAMGDRYKRMHHRVSWKNAVPLILNETGEKVVDIC